MAKVWIVEEKVSKKLLGESGHYLKLDGKLDTAYFVSAEGEEYVEGHKNFLRDFLSYQDKYPIFISFVVYDDQIDDYTNLLNDNNIEFTLIYLEEKRTYYNLSGRHQYHPPCFTSRIEDLHSLDMILKETFWLPAQNEFYCISFSDNLMFKLEEVIEWGRKRKRSIPILKVEERTTFFTIFHDGAGFYIFSNEEKYSTLSKFMSRLPKETLITQIKDKLVTGDNLEE
jgi:hypothetical protein